MSKKQNIILCYFSIILIILLLFGFNTDDLGKLTLTTFLILLLTIVGITTLVTTRGENAITGYIFYRYIFPVILIPFYLFISIFTASILYPYGSYSDISSEEIGKYTFSARITRSKFYLNNKIGFGLKLESVIVSVNTRTTENEVTTQSVELKCGGTAFETGECTGTANLKEAYDKENWSFSVISAKGRWIYSDIAILVLMLLYVPIGMSIVLLTRAREAMDDEAVNKAIFYKKFAFYTVIYLGGILLWPFFLNSWFSAEANAKQREGSALDEFIRVIKSENSELGKADVAIAVEQAYSFLLCEVVDKAEISAKALELSTGPMPYSTNDLALSVALYFFSKPALKSSLEEVQLFARMKLQEWIKEKSVNLILVKAFEDKLYTTYK